MRIVIFPRYDSSQASTRVRVMQYLPFLKEAGIDVEVFPILGQDGISGRSSWFKFLISRIKSIYQVGKHLYKEKGRQSIIHLHSELFPFVPFWIEYGYLSFLGKRTYIIEFDDAWFHRYDANKSFLVRAILGKKIDKLMEHSALVIAGNQYIAERARLAGAHSIEIIPTVVDLTMYDINTQISKGKISFFDFDQRNGVGDRVEFKKKVIIGWIGTPATTKHLLKITNVIRYFVSNDIARFVAIGADPVQTKDVPIDIIPWNVDNESHVLNKFDIGIMPLSDSVFEQGKCGYKIIQYMACKLPVVVSPVGVNNEIVIHNETGYFAESDEEWKKYLSILVNDLDMRHSFGDKGYTRVDNYYSLRVTSTKYVSLLKKILSGNFNFNLIF